MSKRVIFIVEGRGTFPVDMLRYDCCYPSGSKDAAALLTKEPRRVVLIGERITAARWKSFLWNVTSSQVY